MQLNLGENYEPCFNTSQNGGNNWLVSQREGKDIATSANFSADLHSLGQYPEELVSCLKQLSVLTNHGRTWSSLLWKKTLDGLGFTSKGKTLTSFFDDGVLLALTDGDVPSTCTWLFLSKMRYCWYATTSSARPFTGCEYVNPIWLNRCWSLQEKICCPSW